MRTVIFDTARNFRGRHIPVHYDSREVGFARIDEHNIILVIEDDNVARIVRRDGPRSLSIHIGGQPNGNKEI